MTITLRAKANYVVDIALLISFLFLFTTGLIKFPGLVGLFGMNFGGMPIGLISGIHDWSGITMGVLVLIHIILHWSNIVAVTKKLFK
jgi:hypothetical protein